MASEALPKFHVLVDFGDGIPGSEQGPVLLAMEKALRIAGYPVEVYKRTMADDNKRRRDMTEQQRADL